MDDDNDDALTDAAVRAFTWCFTLAPPTPGQLLAAIIGVAVAIVVSLAGFVWLGVLVLLWPLFVFGRQWYFATDETRRGSKHNPPGVAGRGFGGDITRPDAEMPLPSGDPALRRRVRDLAEVVETQQSEIVDLRRHVEHLESRLEDSGTTG